MVFSSHKNPMHLLLLIAHQTAAQRWSVDNWIDLILSTFNSGLFKLPILLFTSWFFRTNIFGQNSPWQAAFAIAPRVPLVWCLPRPEWPFGTCSKFKICPSVVDRRKQYCFPAASLVHPKAYSSLNRCIGCTNAFFVGFKLLSWLDWVCCKNNIF